MRIVAGLAMGLLCVPVAQAQAPDFTLVVLPDIQGYSEAYPAELDAQTQWIVDNKTALNIVYVIQNGDLVETRSNPSEWVRASNGLGRLDGVVPYGITVGNHDLDDDQATGAGTLYRSYFPISRFSSQPGFGAYYQAGQVTRNSWYHTFSSGGLDFLVLILEWEAPDDVLSWASGVLAAHPNHRVIAATHHYLNPSPPNRDMSWPWPRYAPNLGEDMWQEFVRHEPNVFMVHSAHIYGEDRQTSINDAGNPVYEIVVNYHPHRPRGGQSWLRYYTFRPSLNEIHAFTYNPILMQYETDSNSQFVLPYDMSSGTMCTPSCTGRSCGGDGCGGSCGTCPPGETCNASGTCVCTPDCTGRSCGGDGCGGTCGSCAGGRVCAAGGSCLCGATLTDCGTCVDTRTDEAHCGGCDRACAGGQECVASSCTAPGGPDAGCVADCSGRTCGGDGCGGSCGTCAGEQLCASGGRCACTSDRTLCGATCVDTRSDATHCGGCGFTCGTGFACVAGQCEGLSTHDAGAESPADAATGPFDAGTVRPDGNPTVDDGGADRAEDASAAPESELPLTGHTCAALPGTRGRPLALGVWLAVVTVIGRRSRRRAEAVPGKRD